MQINSLQVEQTSLTKQLDQLCNGYFNLAKGKFD